MFRSKNKDYTLEPKRTDTLKSGHDGKTHIVGGKIPHSGARNSPSIVSLTDANGQIIGSQTNDDMSADVDATKSLDNVPGPKMQDLSSENPSSYVKKGPKIKQDQKAEANKQQKKGEKPRKK